MNIMMSMVIGFQLVNDRTNSEIIELIRRSVVKLSFENITTQIDLLLEEKTVDSYMGL